MNDRTLIAVNSKGGVGKTSLAANISGLAAHSGWRVLAIDLDPQGNLGIDLGTIESADNDDGAGLYMAALTGQRPQSIVKEVRPNLDWLPGGSEISQFESFLSVQNSKQQLDAGKAPSKFQQAIDSVADDYDLIVMDTPPAHESPITTEALSAARFAVIPVAPDRASIYGLPTLAQLIGKLASMGRVEHLEVLGIVLFDVAVNAHQINRESRDLIAEVLGDADVPVLDTTIRSASRAAKDMRDQGILAHEYEGRAAHATPWYEARRQGLQVPRFASNADGLAGDYERVTTEVLAAFTERLEAAEGEIADEVPA